jgi:hypothetical protein
MKTGNMSVEEMQSCLEQVDSTVGCANCLAVWWAENATPDMTEFHKEGCPLKGNRTAHAVFINLDYAEEQYGKRMGRPGT